MALRLLEVVEEMPAQPTQKDLVLERFHSKLKQVQSGEKKHYTLAIFTQDLTGDWALSSTVNAEGNLDQRLFSNDEIKLGIQQLFNELIGKTDGWKKVDEIIDNQPPADTDSSNPNCTVLMWNIDTVDKNVGIRVEKVRNERGEVDRRYSLVNLNA